MKVSFVFNCELYSKTGSGVCLENAAISQIQDMFENQNGKPTIVLKTFKRLDMKRTPIIILILKKFKI